jgi:hypothetical protein
MPRSKLQKYHYRTYSMVKVPVLHVQMNPSRGMSPLPGSEPGDIGDLHPAPEARDGDYLGATSDDEEYEDDKRVFRVVLIALILCFIMSQLATILRPLTGMLPIPSSFRLLISDR